MEIDFPLGLNGTEGLPATQSRLKNCLNASGSIIQRPGISPLGENGRVARGAFEWNGSLYEVASTDLLKVNTDGTHVVIDTIDGTANIDSAIGFNTAVIVVKGGNAYTLDKSDVVVQIVDLDYAPSDSVCHINGRFVYIPSNGDPAFFSDVGAAGTIQTNSFFDAEELPDLNKVCFNLGNVLHIGGTDSFEKFRDLGVDPTVPFQRLNARIDFGYIGGILEYGNTFLFIGREKGQNLGIYATDQGIAPKISNEYIDTILNTYTEEELSVCISGRIKWNGYDIATFALARHSWGFIGGSWFELDTRIDGENIPWQAGFIVEHNLKYYSFNSSDIGVFDAINTDNGNPFERLINGTFESENDFSLQRLEYRLSQGYNSAVGSVGLQVSDDNVLFGPVFHRLTGALGEYSQKLEWNYPGGLGYYDGLFAYKIFTAEDIDFSASKLMLGER